MTRKTYRTFFLKSNQIPLTLKDGKRYYADFIGGVRFDSTAKFSTEDEDIQKALEASDGFGRDFYIESEENLDAPREVVVASSPEPEKELVTMKDSRRFKNLVEMKDAMKEVGIEFEPNWNYAKCVVVASKQGYDFQIKKK